jgi:hypothetical protein
MPSSTIAKGGSGGKTGVTSTPAASVAKPAPSATGTTLNAQRTFE